MRNCTVNSPTPNFQLCTPDPAIFLQFFPLEVCLAILQSAAERKEIQMSHQVAAWE